MLRAERIETLSQQIEALPFTIRYNTDRLRELIQYCKDENDFYVLLEVLRAIEQSCRFDKQDYSNYRECKLQWRELLKSFYKRLSILSVTAYDCPQRFELKLYSMLIELDDEQVIDDAFKVWQSFGLDELPVILRCAAYTAIRRRGTDEQRQMLLDRLEKVGLEEERLRLVLYR